MLRWSCCCWMGLAQKLVKKVSLKPEEILALLSFFATIRLCQYSYTASSCRFHRKLENLMNEHSVFLANFETWNRFHKQVFTQWNGIPYLTVWKYNGSWVSCFGYRKPDIFIRSAWRGNVTSATKIYVLNDFPPLFSMRRAFTFYYICSISVLCWNWMSSHKPSGLVMSASWTHPFTGGSCLQKKAEEGS